MNWELGSERRRLKSRNYQTSKDRLGYDSATDNGKKITFISKGLSKYQGQPEEWECNGINKLGFEIFTDVINSMGKGYNLNEKEGIISITEIEQVLQSMRLKTEAFSIMVHMVKQNYEGIEYEVLQSMRVTSR